MKVDPDFYDSNDCWTVNGVGSMCVDSDQDGALSHFHA